MDHFKLHSEYAPIGDQRQAIDQLVKGFQEGDQFETLLGVTGEMRKVAVFVHHIIQSGNRKERIVIYE